MSFSREDFNQRDSYINELFAPEDSCLSKIRTELRQDGKEGINVGPFEGRLLQVLVKMNRVKTIVEVGTLYGYSALWMARALPEDGKIYCLEYSEEICAKAKQLLSDTEVSRKIEFVLGDATETLETLNEKGPFDMAFIDANKGGYVKYLDWAEKNIKTGGIIVGDNTFLFGHIFGSEKSSISNISETQIEVMKSFNKRLSNSELYDSVIIPTAEGMTVAVKK